jgi:hypothetical protein
VDIGNYVRNDDAVVFSREFGSYYHVTMAEDADTVRDRLAVTIAHELAHNLGLRHVDNAYNDDLMKKNSPRASTATLTDELRDLPASENWPDTARQQNDQAYLRSTLGTTGIGSLLASSWNWLRAEVYKWFTFSLDTTKPIYDVTIGTSSPLTDTDGNGVVDDDIAPQELHFDKLDSATQLQLRDITGSDKFFLMGSSKPGGPVDITTGMLDASGHVSLASALVEMQDANGDPLTGVRLSKASGGTLKPLTTFGLENSPLANVTWAGPLGQKFADADGDAYTVKLSGPGHVAVVLDDPDGDGKGPIQTVYLEGTGAKSTLTVTVQKAKAGDGLVTIGTIDGTGLKSLQAPKSPLIGEGIKMAGQYLGTAVVGDIRNGAGISAGGQNTQKSSLTAGQIGDGSSIVFGSQISLFKAASVGDGSITAPAIASLQIAGAFGSDMTLAGVGGSAKQPTLGTVRIAGGLAGLGAVAWSVTGDAGAITVGGTINSWSATTGALKSLTAARIQNATVTATALGAVKAWSWEAGSLTANTVASLTVTGHAGNARLGQDPVPGNFDAQVTVHGLNVLPHRSAVGASRIAGDVANSNWVIEHGSMAAMTIGGTVMNSTIRSAGGMLSLTLGAVNGSKFLAGLAEDKAPADVVVADVDAAGTIGSLTIRGWRVPNGQAIPTFFSGSTFLAAAFGTVALLNADPNNANGFYLLSSSAVKSVKYTDTATPANSWRSPWNPRLPEPALWAAMKHLIPT